MKKILDLARVVRSKNSGPFELVLDMLEQASQVLLDEIKARL